MNCINGKNELILINSEEKKIWLDYLLKIILNQNISWLNVVLVWNAKCF